MNRSTLEHRSPAQAPSFDERRMARRRALAWWTFALLLIAVLSLVGI